MISTVLHLAISPGSQNSLLEWLTAVGTLSSSFIAVYFGAIRPMQQRAKFIIHQPIKSTFHSIHDDSELCKDGDMVELGFLIEQASGTPSNNVNILVKKIWYWDEEKIKTAWKHFVPSNLKWAANDTHFSTGVSRYCHLGYYGNPVINPFVERVFNLCTTENIGDPIFDSFSSMLPDSRKYEIELIISGENVKVSEFKVEIILNDPNTLGPIGEDNLPVGVKLIDSIEAKILT